MNSIVTLGTFCLTHPFYLRPSDGGKEECLGGRTGHRSWMTGLPDPSPHCPDDPGPQLYHWPPKISYSTSAPLTKPWHRFANAEGTHAKEWRKRLAGPIHGHWHAQRHWPAKNGAGLKLIRLLVNAALTLVRHDHCVYIWKRNGIITV